MKTKVKTDKEPFLPETSIDISYLQKTRRHQYQPFSSEKGIKCRGDKFDYVVEWEIHEEAYEE